MPAFWSRYEFASTVARDAKVYRPEDVQQLVVVDGSPPTWYLIVAVTLGVATFTEIGGGGGGMTFGSPVALTVGGSNVDGVGTDAARNDHKHALPAFGSIAGTFCEGNDTRLSDSRTPTAHASTHLPGGTDALTTAAPGAIQPDDAAAEGSAASFARSDHKHQIVGAAGSQGIGGGNTEGSATSFARSDHDHKLRETGGPTDLAIGAVADLQLLSRSGSSIVGVAATAASIGLSSTANIWDPDIPFASPSSYDDEFDGANGATTGWTPFDNPAGSTTSSTNSMDGNGHWIIRQAAQGSYKPVGAYKVLSNTNVTVFCKGRCIGAFASSVFFFFFLGTHSGAGAWVTTDATAGVRIDFMNGNTVTDSGGLALATRVKPSYFTQTNLGSNAGSSTGNRMLDGSMNAEFIIRLRLDSSANAFFADYGPGYSGRAYQAVDRAGTITPNQFKAIGFAYTYLNGAPANPDPTTPMMELDYVRVLTGSSQSDQCVGRKITRYFT